MMEGQLNQEDSVLKVAVKTMKSESACVCTRDPSPSLGLFPVRLRRQESRKVHGKLALPQNLSVSRQEVSPY